MQFDKNASPHELEAKLKKILLQNEHTIEELRCIQALHLKDGWVAAGYVRNQVWDYLHGFHERTPLNDIDVIYFDETDTSRKQEQHFEMRLRRCHGNLNWSVKNQARMHLRNQAQPYTSIEDAVKRWPETATAVGIRLNSQDEMEVLAPYGLEDLFSLKIRKSPFFMDHAYFLRRVYSKGWTDQWSKLQLV